MTKYDYFNAIETLADQAFRAVKLSCSDISSTSKRDYEEIRSESNKILFSIERSLFGDFLPPLERENIASYAHSLMALINTAGEHLAICLSYIGVRKILDEEKLCIQLADFIKKESTILRSLKKSEKIPDIENFRKLLNSAFETHSRELAKTNSGAFPKFYKSLINSTGNLRGELAHCFNKLLETMLNNI